MIKAISQALFPTEYREFPHKRLLIVLLRSIHIICFSILVGGYFFQQNQGLLLPWFLGAMLSGLTMFLIDMYGSCIILFEVRGITILLKLLLLALIPMVSNNFQVAILLFVIFLSSYISHTTAKVRHKVLLANALIKKYRLK